METDTMIILLVLFLAACGAGQSMDSGIPELTVEPPTATSSEAPPTPSIAPPKWNRTPSCDLLTTAQVRSALGGSDVQEPMGNLFRATNGSSDVQVDIDMCSWQQLAGSEPGRSVQVETVTALSDEDADKEYLAAVEQFATHTAPGFQPVPVSKVGARAVRLPEWLLAQNGRIIFHVHITMTDKGPVEPAVLETTARLVALRLNW
jgi:hypothetical protein